MSNWELESFINALDVLYHVALWFGTIALLAIAVYAVCRIIGLVCKVSRRCFVTEKDYTTYLWDKANGNAPRHLSMVIVSSDDGWQACYLDGEKFHEAERISPWDVGMCLAGCTVTHLFVKQEWLDTHQGTYPRMLAEVEVDDDPT